MTLYCCQYRQSALHCTCCSKLQFAHTQLYTDRLIKFQIWKQPRKDGIYSLHIPEMGKSQLLLPSVDPAGKSALPLPPVDPSIYSGL